MIVLKRQDLIRALHRVLIVSRNTASDTPLLGKVIDGELVLWYESFGASLWVSIPDIEGELGLFSIYMDKLYKVLPNWKQDEVKLTLLDDSSLRVSCGRNRITVPYDEGVFDDIIMPDEGEYRGRLPRGISDSFGEVLPFLSKVETMSGVMACVNLVGRARDVVEAMGCDTFHVYIQSEDYDGDYFSMLIPDKMVEVLSVLLGYDMTVEVYEMPNDYYLFETDAGFSLQIGHFMGNYPNLYQVIEGDYKELCTFTYDDMMDSIKTVESIDDSRIIRLYSEGDDVRVATYRDIYETDLYLENARTTVNEFKLTVNTTFFRHCLDRYPKDNNLRLLYNEDKKILKIADAEDSLITSLMVIVQNDSV